jgi:hypothetical protein
MSVYKCHARCLCLWLCFIGCPFISVMPGVCVYDCASYNLHWIELCNFFKLLICSLWLLFGASFFLQLSTIIWETSMSWDLLLYYFHLYSIVIVMCCVSIYRYIYVIFRGLPVKIHFHLNGIIQRRKFLGRRWRLVYIYIQSGFFLFELHLDFNLNLLM